MSTTACVSSSRIDEIIKFWFGRVETTIVPSENRARIWFSEDDDVDNEVSDVFSSDLASAIAGQYDQWQSTARGHLALVLILDQFSRHVYRNQPAAYAQDEMALNVTLHGLDAELDHELSLIERVFFYFPLLHSEELAHQERSVVVYQNLAEMAFAETRVIYDSFLKFANHHYSIIQRYGRFPQRNEILSRASTSIELDYLAQIHEQEEQAL